MYVFWWCRTHLDLQQIPVITSEAVSKAGQFQLQTEAMNDAMEEKLSSYQVPVPEVSGLSFPVQITIDNLENGCTQRVDERLFDNIYFPIASNKAYQSYMNEVSTHVARDTPKNLQNPKNYCCSSSGSVRDA